MKKSNSLRVHVTPASSAALLPTFSSPSRGNSRFDTLRRSQRQSRRKSFTIDYDKPFEDYGIPVRMESVPEPRKMRTKRQNNICTKTWDCLKRESHFYLPILFFTILILSWLYFSGSDPLVDGTSLLAAAIGSFLFSSFGVAVTILLLIYATSPRGNELFFFWTVFTVAHGALFFIGITLNAQSSEIGLSHSLNNIFGLVLMFYSMLAVTLLR